MVRRNSDPPPPPRRGFGGGGGGVYPLYDVVPPRPQKVIGYVTDKQIEEVLKEHGLHATGQNFKLARDLIALKEQV